MKIDRYPEHILQLQYNDGFIQAWFTLLHDQNFTRQSAFEKLNDDFFHYFGRYRYTDYRVFTKCKNEFIGKMRKQQRENKPGK